MLRARFTPYVTIPNLTTPVLNTDEAILAAYADLGIRISPKMALRQARSRGVIHQWTVWDDDTPTDIRWITEYWCQVEIDRLNQEPVMQVRLQA